MNIPIIIILYILAPLYLLRRYISFLRSAVSPPEDRIYYYDGELSFDALKGQIGKIEKVKNRDLDSLKQQLEFYEENSEKTGHDIDYYYQDYLGPSIKYILINSKSVFKGSWALVDEKLRSFLYYCFFLATFPTIIFLIKSNFLSFFSFLMVFLMLGLGTVILSLVLKLFSIYLSRLRDKFRINGNNLGHISKAILALEGLEAAMGGTNSIGADAVHDAPAGSSGTVSAFGGGVSFGGSGGGGFGGFGGGVSGGGGSSGSW